MIQILDNFFEEKLFINVKNYVTTKLIFTPRYHDENKERNNDNYYGSRFQLTQDKNLLDTFVKQSEKKFNIKIKELGFDSGVDIKNLNNFQPHIDKGLKLNILIMIAGPTAVTNGTVFYADEKNSKVLDIHVGFRENRAIMFSSDIWHSPHANKESNTKRYTASLFVVDYDV